MQASALNESAPTPLRQTLVEHHRRCLPGLAQLELAAQDSPSAEQAETLKAATDEVLEELRHAQLILTESSADGPRRASLTGFLSCRLRRLDVAADDVIAAAMAGDAATLRRLLYRFRVLAAAMWHVQLGVSATRRSSTR